MHPAFSVIFLTTLIGAGQGLFIAIVLIEYLSEWGLLPEQDPAFFVFGILGVLILLGLGLFASFFHLGRPERAWRTATKWRTSWLSREVIVLPAFMGVVFLYGFVHWSGMNPALMALNNHYIVQASGILGFLGILLALALFVCTAMIYAAVKFLQEWHSPLTVVNYTVLGAASGFTLATAMADWLAPSLVFLLGLVALGLTALGFLTRIAALYRNSRIKPKSTLQTAIGIKHPRIVQKSQGFMGGSFNTREFFHHRSPAFLLGIKWTFLVGAFLAPVILLITGMALSALEASSILLTAAFAVQYLSLLAERWYFFAEANHPQNLYYQSVA